MTNQYEDADMGAAEEAELIAEASGQSPEDEIEATVQAEIAADEKLGSEIIETTAVVVKDTMSLSDVMQLGSIALASGNFPDLRNNEQAIVRIMAGRELGLQPMTALRDLYVVEGKVAMSSGLIASMVRNHPKYDYRITTMDNDMCELEFFEGEFPVGKSKFTIEDAKQAGIYRQGSGWTKYPRNMLFARALTNGARWYCPDAFDGAVYTPEELKPVEVSSPNYSSPPVTGVVTNAQPAEQSWGSPAATPSINALPQERTLYPVGANEEQLKSEVCPVHLNHPASMGESRGRPVEFFKKGAMRSYAHPTGPREARAPWCGWQEVCDDIKDEAADVLADAGYSEGGERRSMVEAVFDDLIDIPFTAYRISDWKAIADYDWAATGGEPNAESNENEAEQNTML
jgi:hypothetical protein